MQGIPTPGTRGCKIEMTKEIIKSETVGQCYKRTGNTKGYSESMVQRISDGREKTLTKQTNLTTTSY